MYILGISAFYHDSAACLIEDGIIVAAVQEERFTRIKHDKSFPSQAIEACLKLAGISLSDISNVVFYEKPFPKFERLVETYLAFAPKGFKSFRAAMPVWLNEKIFLKTLLSRNLDEISPIPIDWKKKLLFSEHHLSHAASAFFPSPFETAAVVTIDGVGEWATTSIYHGKNNNLTVENEIKFPHSLGLLYSAFTYFTGFKVNSGEYKLMGLAPYGTAKFTKIIKDNLIDVKNDGSYNLNMDYFTYPYSLEMTGEKFSKLFGVSRRKPESDITQMEMDIAASIQAITEEVVFKIAKFSLKSLGERNLCLAGGVALNCVSNGKLHESKIADQIWVQPASGDAGGAVGAALAVWHMHYGKKRSIQNETDKMLGGFLGPEYSEETVKASLDKLGAKYQVFDYDEMLENVSQYLAEGKAVGWMQGRMEFGPRALGNRSIIASPLHEDMQRKLNLKVKYRESFRPFAPSIIADKVSKWFEFTGTSPYMLMVAPVKKDKTYKISKEQEALFGLDKLYAARSKIPAVTHVDYSARIQTVDKKSNPVYFDLLSKFENKTNCPILVNTSFNVRGEPIVCSPIDAYRCFMGTELDVLVIGNIVLEKGKQKISNVQSYEQNYELD